jgi:hypothetical protein
MEKTIQYELFTMRGAVSVFGRILLAKIWIDMSVTICLWIVRIGGGLATQIISEGTIKLYDITVHYSRGNAPWYDIITPLIDMLMALMYLIPFLLMVLAVLICSFIVMIKLVMRSFEIALLLAVSPVFFATWVSDATRQYFRKFIMTFISVVFELVFMALVYAMGVFWVSQAGTILRTDQDIATWAFESFIRGIVVVALLIMMIKPPRVLRELVS